MRIILKAEILEHKEQAANIFLLKVAAPAIAQTATPGQFCMLTPLAREHSTDPLLKRPLSIHSVNKDTVSFLYRCMGSGTHLLSTKKIGEDLELIGPLGHGFDLTRKSYILVGGGMGIAPLLFTAQALTAQNKMPIVLIGARSALELPSVVLKAFEDCAKGLHITTEDGSLGEKGLVTTSLIGLLRQKMPDAVLSCGPWPMLKAVNASAQQHNISCEVSLEAHMACGVGACLGCAIKAAGEGYLHVCKDGPVVNSKLVDWS
ncbi:MAG: dihydroorotate dehydrogenase electron transfer subunit [Dissulfuribacterales bacterium]